MDKLRYGIQKSYPSGFFTHTGTLKELADTFSECIDAANSWGATLPYEFDYIEDLVNTLNDAATVVGAPWSYKWFTLPSREEALKAFDEFDQY